MQRSSILKQAALAGFLVFACLAFGGGSRAIAQVIDCTNGSPGPNMTIEIHNNATMSNNSILQYLPGAVRRRAERYRSMDGGVL